MITGSSAENLGMAPALSAGVMLLASQLPGWSFGSTDRAQPGNLLPMASGNLARFEAISDGTSTVLTALRDTLICWIYHHATPSELLELNAWIRERRGRVEQPNNPEKP